MNNEFMTKYCDTCGTANDDNGKFCVSCGAKLENELNKPVQPTSSDPVGNFNTSYPPPQKDLASQGYTTQGSYDSHTPQGQYPPPYIQGQIQQGQYPNQPYPQSQYPAHNPLMAQETYNGGREKNAAIALLISFFLPGFGHIYAGKVGTGIAMFLAAIFLSWTIIVPLIIWIWGMVGSVNKVGAYNNFVRRYGRPPFPYEY